MWDCLCPCKKRTQNQILHALKIPMIQMNSIIPSDFDPYIINLYKQYNKKKKNKFYNYFVVYIQEEINTNIHKS